MEFFLSYNNSDSTFAQDVRTYFSSVGRFISKVGGVHTFRPRVVTFSDIRALTSCLILDWDEGDRPSDPVAAIRDRCAGKVWKIDEDDLRLEMRQRKLVSMLYVASVTRGYMNGLGEMISPGKRTHFHAPGYRESVVKERGQPLDVRDSFDNLEPGVWLAASGSGKTTYIKKMSKRVVLAYPTLGKTWAAKRDGGDDTDDLIPKDERRTKDRMKVTAARYGELLEKYVAPTFADKYKVLYSNMMGERTHNFWAKYIKSEPLDCVVYLPVNVEMVLKRLRKRGDKDEFYDQVKQHGDKWISEWEAMALELKIPIVRVKENEFLSDFNIIPPIEGPKYMDGDYVVTWPKVPYFWRVMSEKYLTQLVFSQFSELRDYCDANPETVILINLSPKLAPTWIKGVIVLSEEEMLKRADKARADPNRRGQPVGEELMKGYRIFNDDVDLLRGRLEKIHVGIRVGLPHQFEHVDTCYILPQQIPMLQEFEDGYNWTFVEGFKMVRRRGPGLNIDRKLWRGFGTMLSLEGARIPSLSKLENIMERRKRDVSGHMLNALLGPNDDFKLYMDELKWGDDDDEFYGYDFDVPEVKEFHNVDNYYDAVRMLYATKPRARFDSVVTRNVAYMKSVLETFK